MRWVLIFSLFSFVALTFPFAVKAQQDPQFSFYMKQGLFYNPAFAGVEGITEVSVLHRTQWAGYRSTFDDGGAPSGQVFTFNTPIYRLRSGFGAIVLNDNLGPLNNLAVHGAYAYHLGIKNSKLSFGLSAGIYSQSIDFDQYRAVDNPDPVLREGRESQVRPDINAGVYFRTEQYYAGVSFNHLLRAEFDFGVAELRNALENHMAFTFGYFYDINIDVNVTPSLLVQTDFNQYNFILGALLEYKEKIWGGASFRQGEDIGLILGYNFLKDRSLRFGYSFGYVVSGQDAKEPTSHEATLSYRLPVNPGSGKKVVRTPRFRH